MRSPGSNTNHLWAQDPATKRPPPTRPWVLEKYIDGEWVPLATATKQEQLSTTNFSGTVRIRKKAKGE